MNDDDWTQRIRVAGPSNHDSMEPLMKEEATATTANVALGNLIFVATIILILLTPALVWAVYTEVF
jgi:hypothetical protein